MSTTVTSDQIFDMIETIASDPSKNAKVDLVSEYSVHELFQQVLTYTLNPFKRYHIRPSDPTLTSNFTLGGAVFDDATWELLDSLTSRQLSGNAAVDAVNAEFSRLTPKSAGLLWRIIQKDFRAGFSESTVNKAIKGLIPEVPYMRCSLPKDAKLDKFSWKEGVYSQEKADGMFANVNHEEDGNVSITSRNGTEYPIELFSNLVDAVRQAVKCGTQLHGELLVEKAGVVQLREVGNGILNSIQQGGTFAADEKPIYVVWDQIPLKNAVPKGKYSVPYKTRFAELEAQVVKSHTTDLRLISTKIVHSMKEAYMHYGEMLAAGKEGTIFKDGNATWRDGTSKEQIKLKVEAECDLEIVGFTEGSGKNKATFGAIVCRTSDSLLEVGVSGFTDSKRKEISAKREQLLHTILTVRFNDIMEPTGKNTLHSLFLPRAVEFRRDKTTADSLQRVIEQMEAAKNAYIQ